MFEMTLGGYIVNWISFSPKDPLRCSSPVAMETGVELDPLRVNASMQPEGKQDVNGA